MLHGNDRMFDPHHAAHFIHAIACGINDNFSRDIAIFSMNNPFAIRFLGQGFDGVKA